MNKPILISAISANVDVSKIVAEALYNTFVNEITGALRDGQDVNLPGLGKFKTKHRATRNARNPKSGEVITVAAKTVVRFTPAKALKEAL